MKLNVENEPEIELGDELLITPSVGNPYRSTVSRFDSDGQWAYVKTPSPRGTREMKMHREDFEELYVIGSLIINPRQ